jgi:hypothetical protein
MKAGVDVNAPRLVLGTRLAIVPAHAVLDAVALVACGAAEARFGYIVHLTGLAAARYAPSNVDGAFEGGVGVQYVVSVGEMVS